MDYNKIGNFLMTERKKKKLTQAKLAEKLFVSEKTISKWENGNGIPDTNSLPKLCEIFGITINELLNGERIAPKDQHQNEQLLLDMAQALEVKNKIIWKSMWVIMTISLLSFLIGCFLTALLIPKEIWKLITIICLSIVFLAPCFYALKLEICVGIYKCKKCGCEIIPTYREALWAMHAGTTRYLKCPTCHKYTWCKKILSK